MELSLSECNFESKIFFVDYIGPLILSLLLLYIAQISAGLILMWCLFNMFFGYPTALDPMLSHNGDTSNPLANIVSFEYYEQQYQRQERFNNVLIFMIAVMVIHKDIILCNAQLVCSSSYTLSL